MSNFHLLTHVCQKERMSQGRSYIDQNITIHNCFFSRNSFYSGNGAILYVSCGAFDLDIFGTFFFNCSSMNDGGVVWFSSQSSTMKKLCISQCWAASEGHFVFIYAFSKNQIDSISLSSCSPLINGKIPLFMCTGNQLMLNCNISSNNAEEISGIMIHSPKFFTCSLCTFANNKVSNWICFFFWSNNGTMNFTNIIHNDSPSDYGVIYVSGDGSYTMNSCIFDLNKNS